ncbi:unnamed protein product [Rotaria sp. Silwood1]|nr:unnamed protein product [Rotaria sp. Silwood1]
MPTRPPNPNPSLNASKCSRLFQEWVSPFVSKCRKQGTLDVNDLYEPLPDCESATLTNKLEANWFAETKRNPDKPSLIRATLCTMRWKPLLFGLILIPAELLNIIRPLLLTFLMRFFTPCSTMPAWHAWLLAMSIIFVTLCSSAIINYQIYLIDILAMQMRVAYSDQRVKIMSEIIKSMRIVKMYCWEMAFDKKIRHVRRREIIQYMWSLIFDCIQMLFSHTYMNVTFLMMYGTMWWFNIRFDISFFAVASCLLGHMRLTVVEFFNNAVKDLVHYLAAQKRIQAFLLLDESERDNRLLSQSHSELACIEKNDLTIVKSVPTQSPKVVCNVKQAQWDKDGSFCLKNIVFDAHPGDLICIIGPSSLLQTLTGEITIFDGKIRMHGSFCYVPQESWIFSSTIKTNILFGKAYDRNLFRNVVKATALDTDFVQLPNEENTLVGDQGVMLSGGQKARVNMARALYRNADIYLLDDPLSAVDVKVAKHLFQKSIKSYLADKICILVTHQIQFLQDATKIIVLNNGEMVHMGTYTDLLASSTSFARLLDDIHQFEQQQSIEFHQQQSIISSTCSDDDEMLILSKTAETKQKGMVKRHVYTAYIKAGFGLIMGLFIVIILSSMREATSVFSNWWLAKWSDDESYRYRILDNCTSLQKNNKNNNNTIWSMSNAEWNNHRNQQFYIYCGTVVLVGMLNPWSFIPAVISLIGLLYVRYCFAPCFRDLRRLESITRSPVYSYLTSTIHGLKVIRSYHAEHMCSTEFFSHLDDNTRANYLIYITGRWAALRFDWVALIFIALVTILSMTLRVTGHRYFSTADIAMTLSYSLSLMGLLQWTIRLSVDLETRMTSVERVLEYCSLEQEPPAQVPLNRRPPSTWPSHGRIVFDNVSMSHSSDNQSLLALRHISMTIEAGEKVGIVGRTGAGKSSLIQTLFRMGTLVNGQIKIDNIDIALIGLDDVRRHLSIIPQDPVLFTGTMRSNLDPFNEYSDVEIWRALEQVQLKTLVADGMSNGIHSIVSEGGSNLSVGQKQLVCLARAILKMSKILVIDEATANVDNVTDELIQRAIREKFKECTVLTIAHRLRTVIDSDRILVLGNGELLEFDSPKILLSNPNSHFASLVEQAGVAEAEHLRTLANMKSTKDNHNLDQELLLDSKETDPLLT